jgi:acyl dehydratase
MSRSGEQQRRAAGLGLLVGQRAEQVVGLQRVVDERRPPERLEEGLAEVELVGEVGVQRRAVLVVAREQLLAVDGRLRAVAQDDRARVVALDRLEDEVRRAQQGVARALVGPGDRARQREERPEEQVRPVDGEQRARRHGRGRLPRGTVSAMLTLTGIDEVKSHIGQELGVSEWHEVTQQAIDEFADVTGDHQFIHVDPERAKDTPFGGTIAHGYYTLSLLPKFSYEMYSFDGFAFGLNYGLNKVRFPAPLPVGSKVRMRAELVNVEDVPGGIQITTKATFETDAGDKPVCVAESLARAYSGG